MPTQRYKLTIAYRGTRYHGWQAQPALESFKGEPPAEGEGLPTIQEVVAARPGIVRRTPNEAEVAGWIDEAGRLDQVVEH